MKLREHLGEVVMIGIMVLVGGVIWFQRQPTPVQGAGGNFNNVRHNLTASSTPYVSHAMSSTTVTNLDYIGSATTSYAFGADGVDQVDFNILMLTATSTSISTFNTIGEVPTSDSALDLIWTYEFSDDEVNWFPQESTTTQSGLIVQHVVQNSNRWAPGTRATSTINISVHDVNAKFMRINFSSWMATSTRVGLWAVAVAKKGF